MFVTGIFLGALFTGQRWWLPFMLVGYVVIVPLTAILFGDEEDVEEWVDEVTHADVEAAERSDDGQQDALETLRDRYARGELTDEQFERKVERVLETETLEDRGRAGSTSDVSGTRTQREPELERN